MIIQKFYSNINCVDTFVPQFATFIRGICIVVIPDLISEVLHIPRVVYLTTLVVIVFGLCLETNSSPIFVGLLPYGMVSYTLHTRALQKV